MRSTIIKGQGVRIDLGSDVDIIAYVIEIGKCRDYLIYDAELSGSDVLKLLDKFHLLDEFKDQIDKDLMYTITAYDW